MICENLREIFSRVCPLFFYNFGLEIYLISISEARKFSLPVFLPNSGNMIYIFNRFQTKLNSFLLNISGKIKHLCILTFIVLIGIFFSADAQSFSVPAFPISSDTAAYVSLPVGYWQVLADPQGKMGLKDVIQSGLFQDISRTINYKYHVYWLKYRLVNNTGHEIKLSLPEEAAYVDLYTRINNGIWQHARTGKLVPWNERDGLKRIPAFNLVIPAFDTMSVFKRVYWNYVASQPDSLSSNFVFTDKLIEKDYVKDDSFLMTSIQDAFMVGLYVLTIIISFYFFLVVREKEFFLFSVYLLFAALEAIPTLHGVFLREHQRLLLNMYIICNSFLPALMIFFLRYFLKISRRFPRWDIFLIVFSILEVIIMLTTYFASAVFGSNLGTISHFFYNLISMSDGILVLIILYMYVFSPDRAVRLMILGLTPVVFLKVLVYADYTFHHLYSSGFGEPTINGYVSPFNKIGFVILIITFLWMIGLFNGVLFLRFFNIRKGYIQQKDLGQLKSRFFANISHEFRTPLTLMIGPLEDRMQGGSMEKLSAMVPAMYRNSKRLLTLINQLLDLSKVDAAKYRVNTTREDIIPFVQQVMHNFSSLAKQKDISLQLRVDPNLSIAFEIENTSFYFDEDIIEKVLTNLLSNAFKFTPVGGKIEVVMNLYEDKKNYLELRVEDNGPGIPVRKLPYVFDRFYQADASSRRQHEGSGIGLSLVKELIELHGGKIAASNATDKGTVFICLLPLNKKILSGNPDQADAKTPSVTVLESQDTDEQEYADSDQDIISEKSDLLVLIVEDNEDVRKYIWEKLSDLYTILEAENGREGLQIAREKIPDLVISDVMMPEMDGYELCQHLKTDDLTSHIPVILLTARAGDADKLTGLETGADAYLIKPFNSRELLIRVRNLIEIRNKMRAKFSDKLIVKPSEITVTSLDQQFMHKLLATVENHLGDPRFSVDDLAKEMNMSTGQILRKIRALINQSTQQFIRSVRMQRALEMLKKNSGTVAEISWKVGFEDPGYFTKVFKQYFGCLPTEYDKFPVSP